MESDKWVADPSLLRVKTTPIRMVPEQQKSEDQVVELDENHLIRDVPGGTS